MTPLEARLYVMFLKREFLYVQKEYVRKERNWDSAPTAASNYRRPGHCADDICRRLSRDFYDQRSYEDQFVSSRSRPSVSRRDGASRCGALGYVACDPSSIPRLAEQARADRRVRHRIGQLKWPPIKAMTRARRQTSSHLLSLVREGVCMPKTSIVL